MVICTTVLLTALLVLVIVARKKQKDPPQPDLIELISDPAISRVVQQLDKNRYYEKPSNSSEKRSNMRRALAILRLRKLVPDPETRKRIYRMISDHYKK